MGNLLISPYIHLLTPGQKEELIDEYIENNECLPDETYPSNKNFHTIHDKAYSYWNEEEYPDWNQEESAYWNESKRLDAFTERFINLKHSYIEMGLIAWELKFKKLYKKKYHTFNSYCLNELKLSLWQVNRLINASRIALLLIEDHCDYLPACESQARVLTPYTDEEISYYWAVITEKYEGREHELTAKKIWCEIREIRLAEGEEVKESKWVNIKVKRELYNRLWAEAFEYNLSLIEYFEYCLGDLEFAEPAVYSPEQLAIVDELEKQWTDTG